MKIVYIALGGAIGALLRYFVSGFSHEHLKGVFPWGTLTVNLAGALIIGLLWGLFEGAAVSHNVRTFLFIGVLGAFTTFSTFCLENLHLVRDGEISLALINIIASNALGILLVFGGYFFSRAIIK